MRVLNDLVMNQADLSGSPVSTNIDASQMFSISLQAVVTGSSPVGVLSIQASNDMPLNGDMTPFTPTNWNNFVTVAVGSTGTFSIPKTDVSYQWIRTKYLRTSGTGNIDVRIKTNGA